MPPAVAGYYAVLAVLLFKDISCFDGSFYFYFEDNQKKTLGSNLITHQYWATKDLVCMINPPDKENFSIFYSDWYDINH